MRKTKNTPEFKAMRNLTVCVYCKKPIGSGPAANIKVKNGRIDQAHMDCSFLAMGVAPKTPRYNPEAVTLETTKMRADDVDMDDEMDDEEVIHDPNDPNKHRLFKGSYGPYSWCLSCEKAAPTPAFYEADGCPSCGASPMNQWRWAKVLETNPYYPEIPIASEVYPLYGKK